VLELIYWYLIFAASGATFSLFSHYLPIRKMIKLSEGVEHPFVESPIVTMFIWWIAAVIYIPFLVLPLLVEKHRQTFITQTYETSIAD
jgi:hypothetical protein